MRPIKLKMTAFGAYIKTTTLDFEKDLHGERIFLINGATGAGKTTILDAISYALYGETSGKAREIKDMRSKGVADNVSTEVEFTFALGDKIFRVERKIIYHPNRKDNKYEKRALLFCNGKPIETRESAVTNKIIELLGFNADQFRQVVLLPQGEFKKFLSAKAEDRQAVLNVLFDSAPYKKIEDALAERAKKSAAEVTPLQTRRDTLQEQLGGADSVPLAEAEEKFLTAKKKSDELKKISDGAQSELADGKVLAEKFVSLQNTTSELKTAKIQLAEAREKFSAAQSEYQKRKAKDSERKELEQKIYGLKAVKLAKKELAKKNEDLKQAKKKLDDEKKRFDKCEGKSTRYEKRMKQLETEKARLECEKILGEVLKLKSDLSAAQERVSTAKKNLETAQIELTRLQIVNSAAHLAIHLKDGEPCPVCGSIDHPAVISEAIPTVAELQAAEKKVDRLNKEKSRLEKVAANIEGQLSEKKEQLKYNPELSVAQESFTSLQKTIAELEDCLKHIEEGKDYIEQNKKALDAADKGHKAAQSEVDKLTGEINGIKKNIPEEYLLNAEQLDADLTSKQKEFDQLDAAWKEADKNFRDASNEQSAQKATVESVQKSFDELQSELKDKTPPDLSALEQKATEAREKYDAAFTEKVKLENTLKTLKEHSAELEVVKEKLAEAEKIADMWRRLSDVANATGKGESELKLSFQRYFLSTMFNDVVDEANNRLKKMSNGRYLFRMKDAGKSKAQTAGLNLEIFDEYSGAFRPVETLSGGESFLASLSLALGLASVVRNKVGGIQLDTIFIDEGFGSLDSETLDDAIATIVDQSGGRLVGIISHVEELKNQIPVRLEVTKTKTGSTAEFKYGSSRD